MTGGLIGEDAAEMVQGAVQRVLALDVVAARAARLALGEKSMISLT
jgi:hypothetical protein